MITLVFRCFRQPIKWNRKSIYDLKPDYPSLVSNASLNVEQHKGNKNSQRTGVVAIKQGMTTVWDKWGKMFPLTVLLVDRCQVVQVKTKETDGYFALQLGGGERSLVKTTKPLVGHYIKANVPPKQKLIECRVSSDCVLPPGYQLHASHFIPGQLVDIQGVSKGKGFQGVIKRWNFHRQPETHGNSLTTRAHGSTGQRQDPGRTFPGKKMAGHLGNQNATVHNVTVYKIDYDRDLIYVVGGVPGGIGSAVKVRDAIKDKSKQYRKLAHPTDVTPKEGVEVMEASKVDPMEAIFMHDNSEPKIKDEPEESTTTADN